MTKKILPFGFLALLAGAFSANSVVAQNADVNTPEKQRLSGDCEVGAYRSSSGDLVAITTPKGRGVRYYFLDGRWGSTADEQALVACDGDGVLVRQDGGVERWTQVPLRTTPTRFESQGYSLAGMLLEPAASSHKPPLVVMAHGSEDWGWLPAQYPSPFLYAAQGVSVFIFDKHGTGQSEGKFHMNFQRLADDITAAATEARRLAAGRYSAFGLWGASQGGWTVPLAIRSARAEFMIIQFGGIFSPLEEDAEQVQDELRALGYGEDALAKARTVTDATGNLKASDYKHGYEELARLKALYAREPWFKSIEGDFSGDVLDTPEAQLRASINSLELDWDHDAMMVLRENLLIPTLWVLAEQDRESPRRLTDERLKQLIREGKSIQVVSYPDTDHGLVEFVEAADGTRQYTRFTEGPFRLVPDWIKRSLSPPYGRAKFWDKPTS